MKKPFDKEQLLKLLKSHGVKKDSINNLKTPIEDVIPSLRTARLNITEAFFKDITSKLELPFLDYPKVKKICQEHGEVIFEVW
jgi:hypothetical protein